MKTSTAARLYEHSLYGIHYVQYRYRCKSLVEPNAMQKKHGWWRIYRNGHLYAPDFKTFWFRFRAEAMNAVTTAAARRPIRRHVTRQEG